MLSEAEKAAFDILNYINASNSAMLATLQNDGRLLAQVECLKDCKHNLQMALRKLDHFEF